MHYRPHYNCPQSSKDHNAKNKDNVSLKAEANYVNKIFNIKINFDGEIKCNVCEIKSELIFKYGNNHYFEKAESPIRLCQILQIMSLSSTDQKFVNKLNGSISKLYS